MCSLDGEVVVGRRNIGTQSIKEVKGRGCVRTKAVAIVALQRNQEIRSRKGH